MPRAALSYAPLDVRIEDVPEPDAGSRRGEVRLAYNGICGADLHEYFDCARAVPMKPHPLTGAMAPVILGHEAVRFLAAPSTAFVTGAVLPVDGGYLVT